LLAMLLDDFYQETFHAPLIPPASEEVPLAVRRAGRSKRPQVERSDQRRSGRPRRSRDTKRRGR
jgi:hypothetical protein